MKPLPSPTLARLLLRPGVLTESDAARLRAIPCDSADTAAELIADVRDSRAKVIDVMDGGRRVAFLIVEATPAELIVHAAQSLDARAELIDQLITRRGLVDEIARQAECRTVRFHTARPGLLRHALAAGFHVSDVILRRAV